MAHVSAYVQHGSAADSWCQTPSMTLTLRGTTIEGALSQVPGGNTTSSISGTMTYSGIGTLDLSSAGPDHAISINPLTARLVSRPVFEGPQLAAFKARLKQLTSIPMKPPMSEPLISRFTIHCPVGSSCARASATIWPVGIVLAAGETITDANVAAFKKADSKSVRIKPVASEIIDYLSADKEEGVMIAQANTQNSSAAWIAITAASAAATIPTGGFARGPAAVAPRRPRTAAAARATHRSAARRGARRGRGAVLADSYEGDNYVGPQKVLLH